MKKPNWRLIRSGPGNAAWNMALDEAINRNCLEGLSPPTLRFYGWEQPAFTIGRFQKLPLPKHDSNFSESGFVRRITGGRAVRHGRDLTFSLSAGINQQDISTLPREGFTTVARLIKTAFQRFKINLNWGAGSPRPQTRNPNSQTDCFSLMETFELGFNGEKILGCAQKRFKKGLLQQGTLRFENLKKHLEPERFLDLERGLPTGIKEAFERGLNLEFSTQEASSAECSLAVNLEKLRYRNPDWNRRGKPIEI